MEAHVAPRLLLTRSVRDVILTSCAQEFLTCWGVEDVFVRRVDLFVLETHIYAAAGCAVG